MIEPSQIFSFKREDAKKTESGFLVNWEIPSQSPYLEGHFPDNPVFPAVAIIDVSKEWVQLLTGLELRITKIKIGKFTKVLQPLMQVEIHLLERKKGEWEIEWYSNDQCSATLVLEF
jgi:3-hydroxymyristoyl/3-hydroxydecanoyl-(acyl carrier protein) dehydratase